MSRRPFARIKEAAREMLIGLSFWIDRIASYIQAPVGWFPPYGVKEDDYSVYFHWADRLRWWIESHISGPLFNLGFEGSEEELMMAEDIPWQYLNQRQKAFLWMQWFKATYDPRRLLTCGAEGGVR